MYLIKGFTLFALSFGLVFSATYVANAEEAVSFASSPLWLSQTHVTEGVTVQVSTVVMKKEVDSAQGTVTFLSDAKVIGTADFSLSSTVGGAVVAVSFVPQIGVHGISAQISKVTVSRDGKEVVSTVPQSIQATEKVTVDPDTDRDTLTDAIDPDDDNDGILDAEEVKAGTNPKVKEVSKQEPVVAGAASTSLDIVSQAKVLAEKSGSSVFQKTENFRLNSAAYFDDKKTAAIKARDAKRADAVPKDVDLDTLIEDKPSLREQVGDRSGMLENAKVQSFSILSMIFNNKYAFYLISIFFVLWMVRKIWKRYSLN